VGVICDLVHVDGDTLRLSFAAARERFVAVTDAVALAGSPHPAAATATGMTVSGGAARLADGTLAGGAGTMAGSLRNLVELGIPFVDAVATMTVAPRAVLGTHAAGVGRICVGDRADVTVLDDALAVRTVLVGGDRVD
jgi:N-acetylglucosamine-6-phosphate deacetylase